MPRPRTTPWRSTLGGAVALVVAITSMMFGTPASARTPSSPDIDTEPAAAPATTSPATTAPAPTTTVPATTAPGTTTTTSTTGTSTTTAPGPTTTTAPSTTTTATPETTTTAPGPTTTAPISPVPDSTNLLWRSRPTANVEWADDGFPVDAVLDGIAYTTWRGDTRDGPPRLTFTLDGGSTTTVSSYYLQAARLYRQRIPTAWVLEGSADGGDWTVLDRQTAGLSELRQTTVLPISNAGRFNVFRLTLANSHGGGGEFELAEFGICAQTCAPATRSPAQRWPSTAYRTPIASANATTNKYQPALTDGLLDPRHTWVATGADATLTLTMPRGLALPVESYQIANGSASADFPKSWRLEGSNDDGRTWTTINERSDDHFRSGSLQAITFYTNKGALAFGQYRFVFTGGDRQSISEIALCPTTCRNLDTYGLGPSVNPQRSPLDVSVDGATTDHRALDNDTVTTGASTSPRPVWHIPAAPSGTTHSVEYSSSNGQPQPIGSYLIAAGPNGGPRSWTVWGKATPNDDWILVDTRSDQALTATPTAFGIGATDPFQALKFEFAAATEPVEVGRLAVCTAIDCHTDVTGPPPGSPWTVWQAQPSGRFPDASLLGNGPLGMSVYGGIDHEELLLNEHQIWSGGPYEAGNDVAAAARSRFADAVYDQDRATASEVFRDNLLYRRDPSSYELAGSLTIDTHQGSQAFGYRRSTDLDTGATTVSYIGENGAHYTRRMFASFADPIMAANFAVADGRQDLTFGVSTPMPDVTVTAAQRTPISASITIDGYGARQGTTPGAIHYRVMALIRANDGRLSVSNDRVVVTDSTDVDVIIAIDTNFGDYRRLDQDPDRLVRDALGNNAVNRRSFANLLDRHVDAYQPMFRRVDFSVPSAPAARVPTDVRARSADRADLQMAVLATQYARYLLMASSTGSEPTTLQGRWNPLVWPKWWSDYHLDINLEMNYWIAENLNVAETANPLFDFIDDLRTEGTRLANTQYGVGNGGWVAHVTSDLWRQSPVNRGAHTQWTEGSTWIAGALWDHYEYGGDTTFLAKRAYPVMKASALFYDGILVTNPDPNNDDLISMFSTSPENRPRDANGWKFDVQVSPTMHVQIARELYTHLIEASTILGVDAAERAEWKRTLARLPDPAPIGSWGQIQEWYVDQDRPEDTHRHISHLWGAAPGNAIDLTDPRRAAAVRTTLEHRKSGGGNGWATAWRALVWARLGDGQEANAEVNRLLRSSYGSLLSSANSYPQIDGTFGLAAVVVEMLMQSQPGELTLLPALPNEWPEGAVAGLRARGGITIERLEWTDGELTTLQIRSRQAQKLTVRSGESSTTITLEPGRVVTLDADLQQQ